jgi:UDP-N-acetylglucosamine:LPS N-acetylglucosamine transferase
MDFESDAAPEATTGGRPPAPGKRVLVLTAAFGEGHNTAARNIVAALDAVAPGEVEARLCDPLPSAFGQFYEFLRKAYLAVISGAAPAWSAIYRALDDGTMLEASLEMLAPVRIELSRILSEFRPHAVISTYPLYPFLLEQLFPSGSPCPFARITVVTDSITLNSTWFRAPADAWIAPNDETGAVLASCGVPGEKIHVLGFPVDPRFGAPGVEPLQPPDRAGHFSVLLMVNHAHRQAPQLVEDLLSLPGLRLTATVSRDPDLEAELAELARRKGVAMEVFGWTDRLPELFATHHLVISKAGGATVQESLAARLPMVISQVVPGQEEGNARLLVGAGAGVVAESPGEIVAAVRGAMADGAKVWLDWRRGAERLSRPGASRDIARFVLAACPP